MLSYFAAMSNNIPPNGLHKINLMLIFKNNRILRNLKFIFIHKLKFSEHVSMVNHHPQECVHFKSKSRIYNILIMTIYAFRNYSIFTNKLIKIGKKPLQ